MNKTNPLKGVLIILGFLEIAFAGYLVLLAYLDNTELNYALPGIFSYAGLSFYTAVSGYTAIGLGSFFFLKGATVARLIGLIATNLVAALCVFLLFRYLFYLSRIVLLTN